MVWVYIQYIMYIQYICTYITYAIGVAIYNAKKLTIPSSNYTLIYENTFVKFENLKGQSRSDQYRLQIYGKMDTNF